MRQRGVVNIEVVVVDVARSTRHGRHGTVKAAWSRIEMARSMRRGRHGAVDTAWSTWHGRRGVVDMAWSMRHGQRWGQRGAVDVTDDRTWSTSSTWCGVIVVLANVAWGHQCCPRPRRCGMASLGSSLSSLPWFHVPTSLKEGRGEGRCGMVLLASSTGSSSLMWRGVALNLVNVAWGCPRPRRRGVKSSLSLLAWQWLLLWSSTLSPTQLGSA